MRAILCRLIKRQLTIFGCFDPRPRDLQPADAPKPKSIETRATVDANCSASISAVRPHRNSHNLTILKIGPKEKPFGNGYSRSIRRRAMPQTELASANRIASQEQVSASIGEINQPISAILMNAEAALRHLVAQPTDREAVRRLLACIIRDGMRTGDIVNRTRALIEENAAAEENARRSTL
jgi:C4-dicarboxylate-specific signal transduction histidine kinase